MPYPEAPLLPFNRAVIQDAFAAGTPDQDRPDVAGHWLILRGDALVVRQTAGALALPFGSLPDGFPPHQTWATPPVFCGAWHGQPLRAGRLAPDAPLPASLVPAPAAFRNSPLDDRLLTLAGLARQILHWRDRSRVCPVCGGAPHGIPRSFGVRCPACDQEFYPHIHPCVIVLVRRGDEFLLVRKPEWPLGQFGLVAGYVEFGESLEECVAREVLEETGLAVTNIRYLCSQNWPFPSQIMVGFSADCAGGDIVVDKAELDEAHWFRADRLPPALSPRRSVARYIIDTYALGLR